MNTKTKNDTETVSIADLPAGLYILKIIGTQKATNTENSINTVGTLSTVPSIKKSANKGYKGYKRY